MSVTAWVKTRLCRVTSSGEVIPELDGIRSLALLIVVSHHILAMYLVESERFGKVVLPRDWYLLAPRDWFINFCLHLNFAIPVLFALSGFILALPFARRYRAGLPPPNLRSYYLRRVVRMEPPYLLSCVTCFLVIVLAFGHGDPVAYFKAFFPHFAASFFYQHNIVFGYASWVNGITWTLEVDIQFYLLVPLLAMIFRIRSVVTRRTVLLLLTLGFSLLSQFVFEPSSNTRLKLSLPNYMHFLLAGYVLADIFADRRDRMPLKSFRGDATFLVSAAILGVLIHSFPAPCLVPPVLPGAAVRGRA